MWRGAAAVLAANRTGASTVPSRSLYPHQWSWDSAFIAIGLRRLDPARARREIETLFAAQWADGRVPHIVFNPAVPLDAYFPSPDFWRSSHAPGAPAAPETSGIVQPPVHALAVWLVHRAAPREPGSRAFLARMYPKLVAWHRYLSEARDLGGAGLAALVHPWESGMDNSPCWDAPLARVVPAPRDSYRRADLDHGSAEDRPTDLDYGRYVRLAAAYRDSGYADRAERPDGARFAVEDPGFNALLIASEYALAAIAAELGEDPGPRTRRARELTGVLVERLWEPGAGLFLSRDLEGKAAKPPEYGAAGLLPLLLPWLPEGIAEALRASLRGPRFGLGTHSLLVPSHDLTSPAQDPRRYWRGPAWFNVNWLLLRGLRQHGDPVGAAALRDAFLRTAGATAFAEYVDPATGRGLGAREFGWTAALCLDLLAEEGVGE
ncbi:hypothetical protein [Streptomyces sp. AM 3-1-1]|uniref:MGH1-like glycoside hydrolase domain-containing protein n=1 Tax=Streptomyces sp. AM 3-1-1 TaxID=3028711 RepID=UPI0023BA0530|nr:hypothetical protein [Streptomyces sp. AM 3-1-1]WEH31579.1 hypothetical protein P0D76_07845 [Streptomyces sp. AM 3-1-1]